MRLDLQQQKQKYMIYLQESLPEGSKISNSAGGFVLWIEVAKLDTKQLKRLALQNKLDIRIGDEELYPHCFRLNIGFDMTATEISVQLSYLMKLIKIYLKE